MLLIYTPEINPRIKYVFSYLFSGIWTGIDYEITEEAALFKKYDGPKFSFAKKPVEDELFFPIHSIFKSDKIEKIEVNVDEIPNFSTPVLFREESEIGFNVFAAIFYTLSRYEEYFITNRDNHNRIMAEDTIAFQNNFLEIAVVDRWSNYLKDFLNKKFSLSIQNKDNFKKIYTFDVDNAYAYTNKSLWRILGATGRDLLNFNFEELNDRTKVLLFNEKDPYDTYEYIFSKLDSEKDKIIFFFLTADYAEFDKNIKYDSKGFKKMVKYVIEKGAKVGIHPGYNSANDKKKLKNEIDRLSSLTNMAVERSRQHFLRFDIPESYRNLRKNNILKDYSMGFANHIGFRAGTSKPFHFFSLRKNKTSPLVIHPFAMMDATLNNYMKLSPELAIEKARQLFDETKSTNGHFTILWHNETLSEKREWKGWRNVFEAIVDFK
jgi:hypothetical protein